MVPAQAINSSSSPATSADLCLNFFGFVIILLESKSFCAIFLFAVVSKNPFSLYYLWLSSIHSHLSIADYELHHSDKDHHRISLSQPDARLLLTVLSSCPFASPRKDMIRNNAAVDLKNSADRHIQQNGNRVLRHTFSSHQFWNLIKIRSSKFIWQDLLFVTLIVLTCTRQKLMAVSKCLAVPAVFVLPAGMQSNAIPVLHMGSQ